MITTQKFTIYS